MNITVQNRKDQFDEIVTMIQHTRNEVVRLANASLIDLYWRVGRYISDKISISEWGDGVVKQLADYIERNSPEVKGFSDKNLWRMKQFYETYKDADKKLSPLVRQISWTNNLILMSRTKSSDERFFYLTLCQKEHLSKRELNRQIDTALYERSKIGSPKISPVMREIAPQNRVKYWESIWMIIFVRSRKWSNLEVAHSAKYKTSCLPVMPVT